MKKTLLLLMTITPMFFIGCQKEESHLNNQEVFSESTETTNSGNKILYWFISSTSSNYSFQLWDVCYIGTYTTTDPNGYYFTWHAQTSTTATMKAHNTTYFTLTKGVWYYLVPSTSGGTILKFKLKTDSTLPSGACFQYNPSTNTWTTQTDVNLVIDSWTTVSSICTNCC